MKTLLTAILLLAAGATYGQQEATVQLSVSRDTVWQGQRYQVEVSVETGEYDKLDFELPEGVKVLSTSSGQQMGYENGRMYRRLTKGYTIMADEVGTITFGPATVEIAGEPHRTAAVTVVVLPNADYRPAPERAAGNPTRKTYKLK